MRSKRVNLTACKLLEKTPPLYLIDGNALLYRAYYAIRNLSNSQGQATNAAFGFLTSIKKLIEQEDLQYLGIVFDTKEPTFRHQLYSEYKATRKPMPEDLVPQVTIIKELVRALNIPIFEQPGYEADDLLGSLARTANAISIPAVIVTHDKDLYQVVSSHTSVYNPAKEMLLDEEKVRNVFGARPDQVADVLALWGDSSDNIPGVPGIGEKTAKNLIRQFGSLSQLLNDLDKVGNPRIQKLIRHNLEALELSRQLVHIRQDLPLTFNIEDFHISEPNYEKLIPLLQELEFTSLLSEYLNKPEQQEKKYRTILEMPLLLKLINQITEAGRVAIDTETNSPEPTEARLVGMSFAVRPGEAFYLPLGHDYPEVPKQLSKKQALAKLHPILTDPDIKKIGHNIKYDQIVLQREGIVLQGIERDTMLLSYLLEPNWGRHGLDRLALVYLHVNTITYKSLAGTGKQEVTLNSVAISQVAPYACQDADLALQLNSVLWPKIEQNNLAELYQNLELPLVALLADMELWGIRIDPGVLADISDELKEKLARLQIKIFEHSGEEFNLNSPQQLAYILFEKLQLPAAKKTKKTKSFSTSLEVLQALASRFPIAQYMLEYRQLAKLKSTYADTLPRLVSSHDQRIHTSYNQTVAATGRLSSSDPNLQNIPVRGEWGPRFRQAFVPEPGNLFLAADYSQIELRVLAHMSADPALIDIFLNNRDIHQETAARVFGNGAALFSDEPRRRAKIINFSIIYGTSAFSLAKELETTNAEAQQFIDRYFAEYPGVKDFMENCVAEAEKTGYSATILGRRRQVPELQQKNNLTRQAGRRIALNTPVQGSAADLIKKAMLDIRQEMKLRDLRSKMILQVHDELVFEVPESELQDMEQMVQEKMVNVMLLKVPLQVNLGIGVNWAEAK